MFDSLPVIIVSGETKIAADEIISEIIDNDATAEVKPAEDDSPDRVWHLVNKYYSAYVRVRPRADSDAPFAAESVDAHVVVLAPAELQLQALAASTLRRRLAAAPGASVQVVACEAAAVPDAVAELCALHRLEPCALREPPPTSGEHVRPFAQARGVGAVRAALHAHAWPGLRRLGLAGSREEAQESRFLQALGSLGSAAQLTATLTGAERRAAAERLVAEFAAALGHPLDELHFDDAM